MSGRMSRISVPVASSGGASSRSKATRKRKQRGLDAYSIAELENPSHTKIRQHRLGEAVGEDTRRKRQRLLDDDDENENLPHSSTAGRVQRTGVAEGDHDEFDLSGGSDSEGNRWRMGEVGKDEDSDIDSEEAFGPSDEEKYKASSSRLRRPETSAVESRKRHPPGRRSSEKLDLDEMNDSGETMEEEDDLEADGVDLATMLDENYQSSEEGGVEGQKAGEQNERYDDEEFRGFDQEHSNADYTSEDDSSVFSMSDADPEEDDRDRYRQLKDIVASLPRSSVDGKEGSRSGYAAPTLAAALAALKESSGLDPVFDREVKNLSQNLQSSKREKRNSLVHAPLPKRQQDRLDRQAAYGKAKETLDRWIDTVKHNRRAEHLMFPLQDPHAHEPQGLEKLIPTSQSKPQTDLEQTIQDLLKQSGLAGVGTSHEEGQILEWEELQTNKMPLEEVMAKRAELRKARELLFREEVRAKRIKKIKSKAFRRVHRRDAQKAAQKERDLLTMAGIEPSEDAKEVNDRRRAEKRMGARHNESKWAKSVKQTGRAAWDEDARDGVTEMARRDEELRQRMDGQKIRNGGDLGSDVSSEDEEEDDEVSAGNEDTDPRRILLQQLEQATPSAQTEAEVSQLGSMKFMLRADASRRQKNDEEVELIRRELVDEESYSEHDSENNDTVGRQVFGPTARSTEPPRVNIERHEFEEPEGSSGEDGFDQDETDTFQVNTSGARTMSIPKTQLHLQKPKQDRQVLAQPKTKAFSPQVKSKADLNGAPSEPIKALAKTKSQVASSNTRGWTTIRLPAAEEDETQNGNADGTASSHLHEPLVPSNIDLVRSAFGGDDVGATFAAEKAAAELSDDEKITDNALPGWGTWTGQGISKSERKRIQERTQGRFLSKQEGVTPGDRKDKGMERVIMSEKRSKKNAKYLASKLPHPFESRQQYERAIRQPIGPEWTTKETFQNATKPRVLVKPGRRIEPMSTPVL